MEVILAILVAVFMMGAEINGTDLFGCPVGTWYEWLIDIIIIVCLGLEYLGLQKKIKKILSEPKISLTKQSHVLKHVEFYFDF